MSKGKIRLVPSSATKDTPLFDERPIELPGWTLTHRRARPVGIPTIDQTQHALTFVDGLHDSSPFWLADIAFFIGEQAPWGEKASQITAATGLGTQRAYDLASVIRRVPQDARELAQSIDHARLVAKFPPGEQRAWLKRSAREGWGRRDLDREIKQAAKRGVLSGGADLEGMFKVWLVDCPWIYRQAEPSKVSAQTHYPGMTVSELVAMGDSIKAHTTRNAVGFFWVTAPMLYYSTDGVAPDPFLVMNAWGFTPKTGGVWDKVAHNFGHYFSVRHEHLLIGVRGSCTPDRPTPMLDSIFTERKSDVHSEKPACVPTMIERLYDGPYVEMFARQKRKGWTTWGNQINGKVQRAG